MAVPVIEGFKKDNGASSTLTVDKPDDVVTGEMLVIIACNVDNSDTPAFTDNKTGWNFVGQDGNSDSDAHVGVFWRKADGTEGISEDVISNSVDHYVIFYLRISGQDDTTPIHKLIFDAVGNATTHDIDEVTTTLDDCLIVAGLSFHGGDGFRKIGKVTYVPAIHAGNDISRAQPVSRQLTAGLQAGKQNTFNAFRP